MRGKTPLLYDGLPHAVSKLDLKGTSLIHGIKSGKKPRNEFQPCAAFPQAQPCRGTLSLLFFVA